MRFAFAQDICHQLQALLHLLIFVLVDRLKGKKEKGNIYEIVHAYIIWGKRCIIKDIFDKSRPLFGSLRPTRSISQQRRESRKISEQNVLQV